MKKFILAAQLYTVRDQMKTESEISDGLRKIRRSGYEAVQLSAIPAAFANPAWFKAECDGNGLTICSTHTDFNRLEQDPDGVILDHRIMDCRQVGIGCMPGEYRGSREGFLAFAKKAQKTALRLKEEGLTLFYHNHRFEFEKFDGVLGFELLMEAAPDLTFLPDVYWMAAAGVSIPEWLDRLKGRVTQIHFKDYGIRNDTPYICEVGTGNINFPHLAEKCAQLGIDTLIVEQDTCDRDPYESLDISANYMRRHILTV